MAEIFDIVQNLQYKSTVDPSIQGVTAELSKQITSIGVMSIRLDKLHKAFAATATDEVAKREKIRQLIDKQTKAIDNQNIAITKTIQSNKALQQELTKEIGLLNLLDIRYKTLQEAKRKAANVAEIRALNKEMAALEGQINKISNAGKGGGVFSQLKGGLLTGLGIGGGLGVAGLAASGIGALSGFLNESGELAAQVEGVRRAFEALNQPGLLDNLREATRGTVNDLDLMKSAIKFSNFGLPVEKLSIAFEFARRRARDTGESVDYLVESIVTGIGRQSPLILDNLGINAKRVADEFKATGNFAEAAFKIIQEESAKAGEDLDTLAEKQQQLNVKIQNQQIEVGKSFNFYSGLIKSFLADFVSEGNFALTEAFLNAEEKSEELAQAQEGINKRSNAIYLDQYKAFVDQYVNADIQGRQRIKKAAEETYTSMQRTINQFYGAGTQAAKDFLQVQALAFRQFNTTAGKIPLNLSSITPGSVRGLSREQLNSIQDLIQQQSGSLTAGDPRVKQFRELNRAINAELAKSSLNEPPIVKRIKQVKKAAEEAEKPIRLLNDSLTKTFSAFQDVQTDEFKNAPKTVDPNYLLGGQTKEGQNPADRVQALRDSYASLIDVLSTINSLYAQQGQLLDTQFEAQQSRVEQAAILAERGNLREYEAEKKKLEDINREREINARRQLQLNAIIAASNQAVALTEAIGAIVKAAAQGDPYTIAARVIAAVAALVAGVATLRSAFGSGFAEGGYTGDGGKYTPAGIVHKGEFVMNKQNTEKYRPMLEAMHTGSFPVMNTQQVNMKVAGMEKRLDRIAELLEDSGVEVNQTADARGFSQVVRKNIFREQMRMRR